METEEFDLGWKLASQEVFLVFFVLCFPAFRLRKGNVVWAISIATGM